MVNVTCVECTRPPRDPVIVNRYVPCGVFQLGRIDSVDVPLVGFVPNDGVVADGRPLTVSDTAPVVADPEAIATV